MSFAIEPGEVYGLLGENGAGKSTTVEILEGHRRRTAGEVTVLGEDPGSAEPGVPRPHRHRAADVRRRAGAHGAGAARAVRRLLPAGRATSASASASSGSTTPPTSASPSSPGVSGAASTSPWGSSATRSCCSSTSRRPGFDPAARRNAWELIRSLCSDGTTVLLTSHYLDEVEHLADRVGVLRRGRLVAEGTPDSLAAAAGVTTIRFQLPDGSAPGDIAIAARLGRRRSRRARRARDRDADRDAPRADGLGARARASSCRAHGDASVARRHVPHAHQRRPRPT